MLSCDYTILKCLSVSKVNSIASIVDTTRYHRYCSWSVIAHAELVREQLVLVAREVEGAVHALTREHVR